MDRKEQSMRIETDKSVLLKVTSGFSPIEVIFDCGSRDGLDGIELALATGAQELHIFECNPPSFRVCRNNTNNLLGNSLTTVFLNDAAVSDKVGVIDFYPIDINRTVTPHSDGNPGASSIFRANGKYPNEQYVQDKIQVPTITLNEYCRNHRVPDLLWMDLQGAELLALKGAGEILGQIKVIHLEVGFREIYEGQSLFWEIDEYLQRKSFHRAYLDFGRWPPLLAVYRLLHTGPWVANAIYVNKLWHSL